MSAYRTSPIRRARRSQADMDVIRGALYWTLQRHQPMTVRQVFYALTTQGVIAKTEAEYKQTVCRLLADMRRGGVIPYNWLADSTRWMRKPRTYSSAEAALKRTAETYRRALWDDNDVVVEVWLEKEALAGVLVEVTHEWDVPLMVTRGYPSMSFMHSAAEAIHDRGENGQRTTLYYFGDRDPSGLDIDRSIVRGIGESLIALSSDDAEGIIDASSAYAWMHRTPEDAFEEVADFERVAVTQEQIAEWELPTRPTKSSDSRAKGFVGDSVELDAIPVDTLRALAQECIERHIDRQRLDALMVAEAEEREVLTRIAETLDGEAE